MKVPYQKHYLKDAPDEYVENFRDKIGDLFELVVFWSIHNGLNPKALEGLLQTVHLNILGKFIAAMIEQFKYDKQELLSLHIDTFTKNLSAMVDNHLNDLNSSQ